MCYILICAPTFPLSFVFHNECYQGTGGPEFPMVPDGRQFPGCCLVSCSQQMRGELANTWGLSEMLNDAVDRGSMQPASSFMYPHPNVLCLCLCPHSKLLAMTIIWTPGKKIKQSDVFFSVGACEQHIAACKQSDLLVLASKTCMAFCCTWCHDCRMHPLLVVVTARAETERQTFLLLRRVAHRSLLY